MLNLGAKDSGFGAKISKLGKTRPPPLPLPLTARTEPQVDVERIFLLPSHFVPSPVLDRGAPESL